MQTCILISNMQWAGATLLGLQSEGQSLRTTVGEPSIAPKDATLCSLHIMRMLHAADRFAFTIDKV